MGNNSQSVICHDGNTDQNVILTSSGQGREPLSAARKLKVLGALRSRERRRLASSRRSLRNNSRAVNKVVTVVAEHCQLSHSRPERLRHELLLVHEALPEARRPLVMCEAEVGLETELASVGTLALEEGRGDFSSVVEGSGEASTLEQDLEEDLSVESEGSL